MCFELFFGKDAPAGLDLHGLQPFVYGFLSALGADFRGVGLEGHVREALTVDAADVRLVGVEVGWAEPFAGDATFGDGLETAFWRIHFDGGFLDEACAPVCLEDVLDGFFFCQEEGFLNLAAVEFRLLFRNLKNGEAAGALGQDDLGDIKEWIDAGYLVDFLTDGLDGGFIGQEGDVDAFCRGDLLAGLEVAVAVVTVGATTVASASLLATVVATIIATELVAATFAGLVFAFPGLLGIVFLRFGFSTCPGGAEGEIGQKSFEWILGFVAHGMKGRMLTGVVGTSIAVFRQFGKLYARLRGVGGWHPDGWRVF